MMIASKLSDCASERPPATVLVVEDDPFLRFTLATELSQAGYVVREAASADEAETILGTGASIDLVVTDIEMPGTRNGLDLAKSVRAFWPHIGLIVVSGIMPKTGIVGVADAFFGKPYDTERLILRIRSLLNPAQRLARWS